ncbi:MAG: hypothetical protein QT00_C0002G0360 [archaeon GW2011_AR5]|nr:MAG: hypothetical protein QT00_C0002G0360 [archaeon GW2011_AR5]
MKSTTYHVCLSNDDFLKYVDRRMFGREGSKTLSQQSRYFCFDADSRYPEDIMEIVLDKWCKVACDTSIGFDVRRNDVSDAYSIPKKKIRKYYRTVTVGKVE